MVKTVFSLWQRRFEYYADAQTKPWTSEEKSKRLKAFLEILNRKLNRTTVSPFSNLKISLNLLKCLIYPDRVFSGVFTTQVTVSMLSPNAFGKLLVLSALDVMSNTSGTILRLFGTCLNVFRKG